MKLHTVPSAEQQGLVSCYHFSKTVTVRIISFCNLTETIYLDHNLNHL